MSLKIRKLRARKIYNSRGEETVEADVWVDGAFGRAAAPAGKSKGGKEVMYYPEGGVDESVRLINGELAEKLIGLDASDQESVDEALRDFDGTSDFRKLGGNAAFAVSLATAIAASNAQGKQLFEHLKIVDSLKLPYPLGNVIGGGAHAGKGAPDWQEMLVSPIGARNVDDAVKANFLVHARAGKLLDKHLGGFTLGRGDEGAYAPPIRTEEGLRLLKQAADEISDELGFRIRIGVDVAASSLWDPAKKKYVYRTEGIELSREEQMSRVAEWVDRYELFYVEDPLEENDMDGFAELSRMVEGKTLICGDDLIVTNPSILSQAAEKKAVKALIVKPNQVGLLTTAMKSVKIAHERGIVPVVSHRSGEPPEGHLAQLAVAWGGKLLKAGVVGGERVAKANELLRISEVIGKDRMVSL
ncbi:MAG TPA: phosphopyruvate hydratase [Nitrososphaeria archaeon]|nr:MAG: phosphopyruvate hydratase [Nitrososphaerota archaeon]HDD42258.1 phosphopyruvate hydratase [Nitrososphaeria archaeon]